MTAKPTTAWAVVSTRGEIIPGSIKHAEDVCKYSFGPDGSDWEYWESVGLRCIKVRIVSEDQLGKDICGLLNEFWKQNY